MNGYSPPTFIRRGTPAPHSRSRGHLRTIIPLFAAMYVFSGFAGLQAADLFYNFFQDASDGHWQSNDSAYENATGGTWGYALGSEGEAQYRYDQLMEDGQVYDRVMSTRPALRTDGWISGRFDGNDLGRLPANQTITLYATVGLADTAQASNGARFSIIVWDGSAHTIASVDATYDGTLDNMQGDLSPWAGLPVQVYLLVETNGNFTDDHACWVEAKILCDNYTMTRVTSLVRDGYVLFPYKYGLLITTDFDGPFVFNTADYAYVDDPFSGIYGANGRYNMAMVGFVDDGEAWLLHWDESDARVKIEGINDGENAIQITLNFPKNNPSWQLEQLGAGDYVTIAKRYRHIAQQKGFFKSLEEKALQYPSVMELVGAVAFKPFCKTGIAATANPDIYGQHNLGKEWISFTFDETAGIAEHVKNYLGVNKALFTLAGWIRGGYDFSHPAIFPPDDNLGGESGLIDASSRIRATGYLFGLHDNYDILYESAISEFPSIPDDGVMNYDGSRVYFNQWSGGPQYQACPLRQEYYINNNLTDVAARYNPTSYFCDQMLALPQHPCYDPNHPLDKAGYITARQARARQIKSFTGILGTEDFQEWGAAEFDYYEGLLTIQKTYGTYHPNYISRYAAYVPLLELVYRECGAFFTHLADMTKSTGEPDKILDLILLGRTPIFALPTHLYFEREPGDDGYGPQALSHDALFAAATVEAGGVPKSSIVSIPPSDGVIGATRGTYSLLLPTDTPLELNFSIAIADGAAGSNGVIFEIEINGSNAFSQVKENKQWTDHTVDLAPHAGQEITVTFITDPRGEPTADWALWGEPRVVTGSPAITNYDFVASISDSEAYWLIENPFQRADDGWGNGYGLTDRFIKNCTEIMSPLNELTATQEMIGHAFLIHYSPSERNALSDGATFSATPADAGGVTMESLLVTPPSTTPPGQTRVSYTLQLPSDTPLHLSFSTGIEDGAQNTDGVVMHVEIDGERKFSMERQPGSWLSHSVDLNAAAGRPARITFVTEPLGTADDDRSLWGEPKITYGAAGTLHYDFAANIQDADPFWVTARDLFSHGIEKSLFADGTTVIINRGDNEFTCREMVLPSRGFSIEARQFRAFYASEYNGIPYPDGACTIIRSMDGLSLDESSRIRVFHAFGDPALALPTSHNFAFSGGVVIPAQNGFVTLTIDREEIVSFTDEEPTPTPTATPTLPLPTPLPTATPTAHSRLDLGVLLHGLYNATDPDQSRGAAGDYGLTVELRDTADGTGVNYRYHRIALDMNGAFVNGPLDCGDIVPGNYYLVVDQLNHLPVRTLNSYFLDSGTLLTLSLSDPLSPDYAPVYLDTRYTETDGTRSLYGGNGWKDGVESRYINVLDALVWIDANGSTPGSPGWNISADYDANGLINVIDALVWLECNGTSGAVTIAPLTVEITSPTDGEQTNEEYLSVSGTVNDSNAVIDVNGVAASVNNGTFFVSHIPLIVPGEHTITATAQDSGGSVATDQVRVHFTLPDTPTPSATSTFTVSPPPTPLPTHSPTALPSFTPTMTTLPAATATMTDIPTSTPTETVTPTHTPTMTGSSSPSATPTPTVTYAAAATFSATPAPSATSGRTPTHTQTNVPATTPSPTATTYATHTPTLLPSTTPSSTATPTVTPSAPPTTVPSPPPTGTPSITPTITPTPLLVYDFVANSSEGYWTSSRGGYEAATNGEFGHLLSSDGSAAILNFLTMEDGIMYETVMWTHPDWYHDGWIRGTFDNSDFGTLPAGTSLTFQALVGFQEGAQSSNGARFIAAVWDGYWHEVVSVVATYDGALDFIQGDLTPWAGQDIELYLMVETEGDPSFDWAGWLGARIITP